MLSQLPVATPATMMRCHFLYGCAGWLSKQLKYTWRFAASVFSLHLPESRKNNQTLARFGHNSVETTINPQEMSAYPNNIKIMQPLQIGYQHSCDIRHEHS